MCYFKNMYSLFGETSCNLLYKCLFLLFQVFSINDTLLYGMCWMVSLCKHNLNIPVKHYLENVEIPSSLYIPIKQNV